MNGTAVMTALGCLAWDRARVLARLACALTAVASDVTHGNAAHFDPRVFDWKPHPGSKTCAGWIREDLVRIEPATPARLQDRYSLRCAPQVIGVLVEALASCEGTLEIEINGVDDNPLIDPDRGDVIHAGNFYGGHVAFAMDSLKACVASVCDLMDRQLCLLCSSETSDGLPENLVFGTDPEARVHHGFKAMQISASALAAEALKLTMPAAAFSRSTESHNQDKVSMGTIAARDCLRIVELTETVAAVLALAACQAVDLRPGEARAAGSRSLHAEVRKHVPMLERDRRQDHDIQALLGLIRGRALPIGKDRLPFGDALPR
jgi:histidine ammonia-lyase